jgi:hypothetical protein
MVGWIFKRTLLIFVSWIGAILLMFFGFGACISGAAGSSTLLVVIGVILFLGGLFLGMFSKALGKWIQIK